MATENDKVNTGALGTLVAVGTASMIGICLAVNALVRHEIGSVGAARDEVGADAYRALKQGQVAKLDAPAAWSDRGKGHVSVPIERAMNLVLVDLKRSPWNATPAPPLDAGMDASPETPDAGVDAAATPEADGGVVPEPPAPAPLSPSVPTASSKPVPKAPTPQPSGPVLAPPAPAPKPAPPVAPTPAAPTAAVPPPAPAPAAPPATP